MRAKIKFDIGHNEIVNGYAFVLKVTGHYELYFDNGSYDKRVKFDQFRRVFYGFD